MCNKVFKITQQQQKGVAFFEEKKSHQKEVFFTTSIPFQVERPWTLVWPDIYYYWYATTKSISSQYQKINIKGNFP